MEIPGYGDVDLKVGTCSWSAFRKEMGVPVRITVGKPRGFTAGYEEVLEFAPFGKLFKITDRAEFEPAFRARLADKGVAAVRKLAELALAYPGHRLILCCYENVHTPGQWCHRQVVAAWLEEQLGIEVPEVSP